MTSRRSEQRRDVTESGIKQRRDVEYQHHDIPETHKNSLRDVPEGIKTDVATFQRHSKSTSRRSNLTSRRSREGSN